MLNYVIPKSQFSKVQLLQHLAPHIAELFIAVSEDYQGYGIGTILLEDALEWVEEVGTIKRLELTVQARNKKARHLYEKFDFELENVKKWGARDENGQLIDVCEYVLFFD